MPYDQMHGFEAGASSSSSPSSGHYSTSNGNGRARGHPHSMSSDHVRSRSASSMGSVSASSTSSSSRSGSSSSSSSSTTTAPASRASHQGTATVSDTTLSDEQRLILLRQQQAQRRPKMLRLTAAVNHLTSASRSMSATVTPTMSSTSTRHSAESSRPASIVGITSLTGSYLPSSGSTSMSSDTSPNAGLTIVVDPKSSGSQAANGGDLDKVVFPMVGSPPSAHAMPLHPGSRKALAQTAALQPADGATLQLDLGCISGPSMSDSSAASANSAMTVPELVRKKSGEPVKSSLKHFSQSAFLHRSDSSPAAMAPFRAAKSVPNTPTVAKAVHFNPVLEHIKVFKHRQRPTAVSRDGSPEHTETETEEEREFPFYQNWRKHSASVSSPSGSGSPGSAASTPPGEAAAAAEQLVLRLPNFPSSAKLSVDREIFLERVFLSDDLRSVKGTVQVQNLAFEKWVAIRFTLDNWATVCEVSAEYQESIKGGKSDRFTFSIKLNELLIWTRGQQETKTMFMCLRFNAAGQEFWDNNAGDNYQLDFRKRPVARPPARPAAQAESSTLPRSFSPRRSPQLPDTSSLPRSFSPRRSPELRAPGSIEYIHRSLMNMARGETSPGATSPVAPGGTAAASGVEAVVAGVAAASPPPSAPAGPSSPSGSNGTASLMSGPSSSSSHSQAGSGSPTLSSVSDSSSSSSSTGSMKPSSVSSYDELIARFCWHDSSTEAGSPGGVGIGVGGPTPTAGGPGLSPGGHCVSVAGLPISSVGAPELSGSLSPPQGAVHGMHASHMPHRLFADSMGSPTTESGSTTPTIGF
ncbi:hypothetical protein OC834_005597 [Tilletia horrida]|nr:hypothetical protein OC834_005597 [Tilletia horrida]